MNFAVHRIIQPFRTQVEAEIDKGYDITANSSIRREVEGDIEFTLKIVLKPNEDFHGKHITDQILLREGAE